MKTKGVLFMLKTMLAALLALSAAAAFGQAKGAPAKYALVIGNAAYSTNALTKPLNDAKDMAKSLKDLGWQVEKITDCDYAGMKKGIEDLAGKLSQSKGSYGFLYYSGHSAQVDGVMYLLPAKGPEISSKADLASQTISVKTALKDLMAVGNMLNIVVLDGCRITPGWARSGAFDFCGPNGNLPGSIVVYATSEDAAAWEYGRDRNGFFTKHLVKNLQENLKYHEWDVLEVFLRTGKDVQKATTTPPDNQALNEQIPGIYTQFFGTAYLWGNPQ